MANQIENNFTNPDYTITRDLNNITVKKINGSQNKVEVQVFEKNGCHTNSFIKISEVIEVDEVFSLKIPFKNGVYKLRITVTDPITESFTYKEYQFSNYSKLLDSIITDVEDQLCGCDCKDCGEDCGDKKQINITLLKIMSFYFMNKEYYQFFINTASDCISCSLYEGINCLITQESILGKADSEQIFKEMIAYFYIVFYLAEKSIYNCCPDEIDKKFKFDKISKCIKKLGVDINCIQHTILTNPNYKITNNNLIEL